MRVSLKLRTFSTPNIKAPNAISDSKTHLRSAVACPIYWIQLSHCKLATMIGTHNLDRNQCKRLANKEKIFELYMQEQIGFKKIEQNERKSIISDNS